MGLLDSLIGGLSGAGPRPSAPSSTSPMVKAILLLLAAKAAQGVASHSTMTQAGQTGRSGDATGGLSGALGGLLGGAGAGSLIGGLLEQLRGRGLGDYVDSWVGTGQNKTIASPDLARALGPEALSELEQQTGLTRDQWLDELSDELPASIDHVTPAGRVPDDIEIWSGTSASPASPTR